MRSHCLLACKIWAEHDNLTFSLAPPSGQTSHLRNVCAVLAPVSFGEKPISILCGDLLNGLWRQAFDLSDVPAGQNNVTGLIPHLGDRKRQEEVKTSAEVIQLCCSVRTQWLLIIWNSHACRAPAQESRSRDRCVPAGSSGSVCLSVWRYQNRLCHTVIHFMKDWFCQDSRFTLRPPLLHCFLNLFGLWNLKTKLRLRHPTLHRVGERW